MNRGSQRTRNIALVAAAGGGGLGVIGITAAFVVSQQAARIRESIPLTDVDPPPCDGLYGGRRAGKTIELALIGDSSAAGVGAHQTSETPGALLAEGLSKALRKSVRLRCFAVPGARSDALDAQVDKVLAQRADLVVIFIGANDVTHRSRPGVAARQLSGAVRRLIDSGSRVVVGTCPDLSTLEGMQAPLRWVTQYWCRELAAAQAIAAVSAGARTISLGDTLREDFSSRRAELFAEDRFHPSAAGYARAAEVVLPTLITELGYAPELAPAPAGLRRVLRIPREGLRRLPRAAVDAANVTGTEIAPAPEASQRGGLWGELQCRLGQGRESSRSFLAAVRNRLPKRHPGELEADVNQNRTEPVPSTSR